MSASSTHEQLLTIAEVAAHLRCSRAHVFNMINGKVSGTTPLPALALGRRKLVRQGSLDRWKRENEGVADGDKLRPAPDFDAAGRA